MARVRFWILWVVLLVVLGIIVHVRNKPDIVQRNTPATQPSPISKADVDTTAKEFRKDNKADTEKTSEPETEDETASLSEIDLKFRRRVDKIEAELQARLSGLGPAAGLAYLQEVLALQADTTADVMSDDRIRKVLAARFLAWVVDSDHTLGNTVLQLATTLAKNEADTMVRSQIIGILFGAVSSPSAGLRWAREDLPKRVVEGFTVLFEESTMPQWKNALRDYVEKDPATLDILEKLAAATSKEPARRVVLEGLAGLQNDRSKQFVVDLFKNDQTSRFSLVNLLAKRDEPAVLDAFVHALGEESRNDLLVSKLLSRIATTAHARDGWGRVLKNHYERLEAQSSELVNRGEVVAASARVFASTQDAEAFAIVLNALSSTNDSLFHSAVSSIRTNPHPNFVPELNRQLAKATQPYVKEELTYALKKIDPRDPHESLLWDIDVLESQLKENPVTEDKRRIEQQISEKRARLERMRNQR